MKIVDTKDIDIYDQATSDWRFGGSALWSPDGQKIAFGSGCGGWGICVMNADGTNPIKLTEYQVGGGEMVWSPDSTKIAFVSPHDGNAEIYVINADGGNLVRLTNNNTNDYSPVWSP